MSKNVSSRHLKTLRRRLEYLKSLRKKGEANSFDKAEISALSEVLECVQRIQQDHRPQYNE